MKLNQWPLMAEVEDVEEGAVAVADSDVKDPEFEARMDEAFDEAFGEDEESSDAEPKADDPKPDAEPDPDAEAVAEPAAEDEPAGEPENESEPDLNEQEQTAGQPAEISEELRNAALHFGATEDDIEELGVSGVTRFVNIEARRMQRLLQQQNQQQQQPVEPPVEPQQAEAEAEPADFNSLIERQREKMLEHGYEEDVIETQIAAMQAMQAQVEQANAVIQAAQSSYQQQQMQHQQDQINREKNDFMEFTKSVDMPELFGTEENYNDTHIQNLSALWERVNHQRMAAAAAGQDSSMQRRFFDEAMQVQYGKEMQARALRDKGSRLVKQSKRVMGKGDPSSRSVEEVPFSGDFTDDPWLKEFERKAAEG